MKWVSFRARTNHKKESDVLSAEIKKNKIKERYMYLYFKLEIVQNAICKPILIKQARKQINFIIIIFYSVEGFLGF